MSGVALLADQGPHSQVQGHPFLASTSVSCAKAERLAAEKAKKAAEEKAAKEKAKKEAEEKAAKAAKEKVVKSMVAT